MFIIALGLRYTIHIFNMISIEVEYDYDHDVMISNLYEIKKKHRVIPFYSHSQIGLPNLILNKTPIFQQQFSIIDSAKIPDLDTQVTNKNIDQNKKHCK